MGIVQKSIDKLAGLVTRGRKIRIKQGLAKDFKPDSLDVGEFGLITDTNEVRIGIANGTSIKVNDGSDVSIPDASTTQKGIVQLVDNLTSEDNTKALTAKQGKALKTLIDSNAGGSAITVIDNLTSNSPTDALSANQGRLLKDAIDAGGGASPEVEYGNWKPTIDNAILDDNYTGGLYIKRGNLVTLFFYMHIRSLPSSGTFLYIKGVPFIAGAPPGAYVGSSMRFPVVINNMTGVRISADEIEVSGFMSRNVDYFNITKYNKVSETFGNIKAGDLKQDSTLYGEVTYTIAN